MKTILFSAVLALSATAFAETQVNLLANAKSDCESLAVMYSSKMKAGNRYETFSPSGGVLSFVDQNENRVIVTVHGSVKKDDYLLTSSSRGYFCYVCPQESGKLMLKISDESSSAKACGTQL